MALSILSGITINLLVEAVKSDNILTLTKVPGIGKTKAEKLIFELKRKLKNLESYSDNNVIMPSISEDAIYALTSLGFVSRFTVWRNISHLTMFSCES